MPTAVSFLTNAPILRNNKAGGVADHNNCCSSAHLTQCNALFTASNYWLFTGQVFSKYRQQFERVEQYGGGGDPVRIHATMRAANNHDSLILSLYDDF